MASNGHQTIPSRPTDLEIEVAVAGLATRVEVAINLIDREVSLSAETRRKIQSLVIGELRAKTFPDGQLALPLALGDAA